MANTKQMDLGDGPRTCRALKATTRALASIERCQAFGDGRRVQGQPRRGGPRWRGRPRGLGPLQLVAARPEHRVDELALGVLGAELDQLTQRLPAIRAFVVGTLGVEQADGIVRGLDLVDAGE